GIACDNAELRIDGDTRIVLNQALRAGPEDTVGGHGGGVYALECEMESEGRAQSIHNALSGGIATNRADGDGGGIYGLHSRIGLYGGPSCNVGDATSCLATLATVVGN